MKLSDTTVNVLKNFSSINPGIVIREGSQLRTISTNKAILAEATVTEQFPREFGVYDLSKLLGVLSLHGNPELDFQEQFLSLGGVSGRARTRIRYTETKLILQPPNKAMNLPDIDVKFSLSQDDLTWIEKIGSVLGLPYIVITNEAGKITVSAADVKGEAVDDSSLDLGDSNDVNEFKFSLKVENLKLMGGSYVVELASKGIARFSNQNVPVVYYVAVEKSHSFYGKASA